jgi:hypothetical protein
MGVLVEVRRDGKMYPPRQRSAAEIAAIRALEHGLHCRQGLSIRAIQRVLLDKHGIRRSIGMIHYDLTGQCPYCTPPRRGRPPKDPRQRPQVFEWR